ncbi:MAG: GNAT family N-acetyltransferase, partial [Candidatus Limiplasma sp.]|nr:GNAT family N-acetyltransferase [Candidatus Limiplasma sp.]
MTIRRMTLADVDQVHAIELATFPVPWSRQSLVDEMERNVCARYLVAVDDAGSILAYAGAWIIFDEAHVTNVAVAQTHRGQGIGKQIMLALMQYAYNLGAVYLTLEVSRSNTVAQALY